MADVKDIWVTQSPKAMAYGEAHAYLFDFTEVGDGTAPSSIVDVIVYNASGTDKSGTCLAGSNTLLGYTVTTKLFTPDAAGNWRMIVKVLISGNTVWAVMDIAVFATTPSIPTQTAGSYGSLAGVAALVPRYVSRAGTFDDTTRPNGTQVVGLIDQVSGIIDAILAQNGFATPVTNAAVKRALDLFLNQEVAAIIEGINGSGRFGPTTKTGGRRGRFALIFEDVEMFVEANVLGFERMGAERSYGEASGIGYRGTDEKGDDIYPIRQRKEFGNIFDNWDN